MASDTITIAAPDDWHFHGRDFDMLWRVIRHVPPVRRALFMPNLDPPIRAATQMRQYLARVRLAAEQRGVEVEPFGTIYLMADTTPVMVHEAADAGAVAFKAYPRARTTNAQWGLTTADYAALTPVLEAMTEAGLVLCLHGEHPDTEDEQQREADFLPILRDIALAHPELRIVLEHASTKAGVEAVLELPNVAATITAHHLVLTRDDVYEPFQPHHKCMPIAKTPEDRTTLIEAATSGNPKFFLGSDCAPHPREKKETGDPATAASGVFVGNVLLPLLAHVFDQAGVIDRLGDFTGRFGAEFYAVPPNDETITLVREPWTVPDDYDGIVPFMAGKTLQWQLADLFT